MYPALYQHHPSTIESKKELLISLSSMLTNAETQRKIDTNLCEQFTRCKSTKGKGRYSCYEYTDIDTQLVVDFDEFERRYQLLPIFLLIIVIFFPTDIWLLLKAITLSLTIPLE